MPAAFENCVKNGGKVRTISGPRNEKPHLAANEYVHICSLKGKTYLGEVKTKAAKVSGKK